MPRFFPMLSLAAGALLYAQTALARPPSLNPEGTMSVSASSREDSTVTIRTVDQATKAETTMQFPWEWSPEIVLEWVNDSVVVCSQNGRTGPWRQRLPTSTVYSGLIGVFDVKASKTLFLDYVTALWFAPAGDTLVYIDQMGPRSKGGHSIAVIDLLSVQKGRTKPLMTYKDREQEQLGKLASPAEKRHVEFLKSDDQELGSRLFLLAAPLFDPEERAITLLVGGCSETEPINKVARCHIGVPDRKKTLEHLNIRAFSFFDLDYARRSIGDPIFYLDESRSVYYRMPLIVD